jgi:murein DD-endopeptidase MepM/ murein hydrolase activator NlpD
MPAGEAVPPAAQSAPAAPAPALEPPTSPPRSSGAFLWPVRGNVLATYGLRSDGTHNDGINIGAPRGAPILAADAGVVAYTGNELRGYGNLILVKHAGGWISAYAHCDQILVKRGETVSRGQVIARVGSTGNVGDPQLHFELRRGNRPVDPREFLAPLPTAATRESRSS